MTTHRWLGVAFGVGLTAILLCLFMVRVVTALPDCDGSVPVTALCGTETPCPDPVKDPTTGDYVCTNSEIRQQFIQFKCSEPPGSGSTLCGDTDPAVPLVCTTRHDCLLREILDEETAELERECFAWGAGVDNSTATKTEYKTCNDTTDQ